VAIVFKDLQKLVQHSQSQRENIRKELFQRLQGKPFWIWDKQQHKQEDIKTNADCYFNRIIGLPQKNGVHKPLYDYEKIIFDSLVPSSSSSYSYYYDTQDGNANPIPNSNPNFSPSNSMDEISSQLF
jgi:hypothetical protein